MNPFVIFVAIFFGTDLLLLKLYRERNEKSAGAMLFISTIGTIIALTGLMEL